MDTTPSFLTPAPEGSVHEAMHDCEAHTPDPRTYHRVARGTLIPHIPPGMSGAGGGLDLNGPNVEKVEKDVGDGASPAFSANEPKDRVVIRILEDIKTGKETVMDVNNKEFFREDKIQMAISQSGDPAVRMKKLAEMSSNEWPGDIPPEPSIRIARTPSVSPNAAFERALVGPDLSPGLPQHLDYNIKSSQDNNTNYQAMALDLMRQLQEMSSRYARANVDEPSPDKASHPNDYSGAGLPWMKEPAEAPAITVIFNFGKMTFKAKFHEVVERKMKAGMRCLVLYVDERYEGNQFFPEPSEEPFMVSIPERKIAMKCYDADLRVPLGDKASCIMLLEAEDDGE